MPNLKFLLPAIALCLAAVGAAYWAGLQQAPERVVIERVEVPVRVEPEAGHLGEMADFVGTEVEKTDAYRVVAEALGHLRGGVLSQSGILRAFALMGGLDAETVLDAVVEVEAMDPGGPGYSLLMLAVLGRWAELDGVAAMGYAEGKLEGDLRTGAITNIVSSWSESDPKATLAWYRGREADGQLEVLLGSNGPPLLTSIFQGLAAMDAEAAMAELSGRGLGDAFRFALGGMASGMAATGQSAQLMAHVGRLPGDRQAAARQSVLSQWAQYAPADAASWVVGMKPSAEKARLAKDVALAWVRREPRRAVAWMLENTPSTNHAENLGEAVGVWARGDPNAAAAWLGEIEPGPGIDQALAAFSRHIIHRDSESAFAWAERISNVAMREQTVGAVFSQWAIRQPQEALAYLEASDLPEGQVAKLRAMVTDGRK